MASLKLNNQQIYRSIPIHYQIRQIYGNNVTIAFTKISLRHFCSVFYQHAQVSTVAHCMFGIRQYVYDLINLINTLNCHIGFNVVW